VQPEEGVWSLEDLDSIIRLDLRSAQCTMRLFTEGSLVILVGELVQGLFKVVVSHTHTHICIHPLQSLSTLAPIEFTRKIFFDFNLCSARMSSAVKSTYHTFNSICSTSTVEVSKNDLLDSSPIIS
jgi:hypothetical protein